MMRIFSVMAGQMIHRTASAIKYEKNPKDWMN